MICVDKNKEVVEELIKHGADINSTNNNGDTALHVSAIHGITFELLYLFINLKAINSKNELCLRHGEDRRSVN